uniref:Uncharacterized protein n=1 Tax=Amphimedon queenslandica TaxID=400682 RepID=A0A1X7TW30_AMPQE
MKVNQVLEQRMKKLTKKLVLTMERGRKMMMALYEEIDINTDTLLMLLHIYSALKYLQSCYIHSIPYLKTLIASSGLTMSDLIVLLSSSISSPTSLAMRLLPVAYSAG